MLGVHPKVVSERLGHASVAFTLRVYSHVIPGMDAQAAGLVADVILGPPGGPVRESARPDGSSPLVNGETEEVER